MDSLTCSQGISEGEKKRKKKKNLLSDVVVDLEREVKSQFSNQEYFYRWSNP